MESVGDENRPYIILTGSGGYLGEAIIGALSGAYRIIALDKSKPSSGLPKNVEFYQTDLTSERDVSGIFKKIKKEINIPVASVIHLAAYYDFSGEPSPLYETLTVQGTERLLENLNGLDVEQFVFTSTMLVHGPCRTGETINENSPLQPKWDYPRSKIRAEEVIRNYSGPTPFVILRIAGIYDNMCHSIPISHQIQRVYENRLTSHVFPNGTNVGQSFLHLNDFTEAIVKTVERRKTLPNNTVLLLGEPETYSYNEVQQTLGHLIHGKENWTTKTIPKALAKAGAWIQDKAPGVKEPFIKPWMVDIANDHYALNISKARTLLDWSPKHRLIESLPRMVDALKRDPRLWYENNKLDMPQNVLA